MEMDMEMATVGKYIIQKSLGGDNIMDDYFGFYIDNHEILTVYVRDAVFEPIHSYSWEDDYDNSETGSGSGNGFGYSEGDGLGWGNGDIDGDGGTPNFAELEDYDFVDFDPYTSLRWR
jgi:hypothetical protein